MEYLSYLKNNLHLFDFSPATMVEINDIESLLAITFPDVVKEFMLMAGNDYASICASRGTGGLEFLLEDHQDFIDDLAEEGITMTDPFFVLYYDNNFKFIKLNTGPDQEVWDYNPSIVKFGTNIPEFWQKLGYTNGPFIKIYETFSSYTRALVNYKISYNAKYSGGNIT